MDTVAKQATVFEIFIGYISLFCCPTPKLGVEEGPEALSAMVRVEEGRARDVQRITKYIKKFEQF